MFTPLLLGIVGLATRGKLAVNKIFHSDCLFTFQVSFFSFFLFIYLESCLLNNGL